MKFLKIRFIAGHRQDADGSRVRRRNQIVLSQTRRSATRADVYWRRRENGARRVRARKVEIARDHLHRRARRDWHQALQFGQEWRSRSAAHNARIAQSTRWIRCTGMLVACLRAQPRCGDLRAQK